jgi:hypothetical protein
MIDVYSSLSSSRPSKLKVQELASEDDSRDISLLYFFTLLGFSQFLRAVPIFFGACTPLPLMINQVYLSNEKRNELKSHSSQGHLETLSVYVPRTN